MYNNPDLVRAAGSWRQPCGRDQTGLSRSWNRVEAMPVKSPANSRDWTSASCPRRAQRALLLQARASVKPGVPCRLAQAAPLFQPAAGWRRPGSCSLPCPRPGPGRRPRTRGVSSWLDATGLPQPCRTPRGICLRVGLVSGDGPPGHLWGSSAAAARGQAGIAGPGPSSPCTACCSCFCGLRHPDKPKPNLHMLVMPCLLLARPDWPGPCPECPSSSRFLPNTYTRSVPECGTADRWLGACPLLH